MIAVDGPVTSELLTERFDYGKWSLRLFLTRRSNAAANVSPHERVFDQVRKCLQEIDDQFLTDEFTYERIGFGYVHFGRRGITISIWHWGSWGQTIELFCQSWYCYNHDFFDLESLDRREPISSLYDLSIVNSETARMQNAVARGNGSIGAAKPFYF